MGRTAQQIVREGGLTRRIADYAVQAARTPLPKHVAEKAKHHVLDTIAAMVSGSGLAPGILARQYVENLGGRDEASVVGARFRTNAVNAALANAMAAHADETDDAHPSSITHPGCAVVPAALAMGERVGASSETFLRAVVLGYDVCARTGLMLGDGRFLSERGFDPHAFGGVMGAAVAAGTLAVADLGQMTHVLSYAAQQASGLATLFRDKGHVEKAFVFAGMPARNGIAAATMVQLGLTGVGDVFDGTPSFLSTFGVDLEAAAVFDDLGAAYAITQTNIKRWSVGSPAQAVLDSIEALMSEHRFSARDVSALEIHLPNMGARVVDNRDMPSVNVQHLAALMLVDGTVGFEASHDHARMADPRILDVRRRIVLKSSEELTRKEVERQAIVKLTLSDGRCLRHHTHAVRGTAANPMTQAQVAAKALDLMSPRAGADAARQIIHLIDDIENLPSLRQLASLLAHAGTG